jgi:hypothetical protein
VIRNLLLISFGLLVVVIPAFHEWQDFMDCEILSPVHCFETARPQDMASCQTYKFEGLASNISPLAPFVSPDFSEEVSLSPFPFLSPNQQTVPLRC